MNTLDPLIRNRPADTVQDDRVRNPRQGAAPAAGPESRETTPSATKQDDTVTLTESASRIQNLQRQVDESNGFDQDKVQRIKAQLAEGRYVVDPGKIAEKFVELEMALGLR
ncbi:MAG: flagellar biosynthesis anti-sigma factor FlgM [Halothiobacillaceae bacterium]|nr:flagellar biosynthesis anti-sigma factor FlgM [Halothiobacillaceae bacterium]MDY0050093.1 flagellar biosynthesis anti-sigma factor FlgM [Halothiobacillaceae bacterium]